MNHSLMTFFSLVSLIMTLSSGGCDSGGVEPSLKTDSKWVEVSEMAGFDIHDLKVHGSSLYVVVNQRTDSGNFGYIFKSTDGISFSKIKMNHGFLSPITFCNDTLAVTTADSILFFSESMGWRHISKLPFFGVDDIYDIFFLNNKLYIMSTRFWVMDQPNKFREINYPQRGGKFLIAGNPLMEVAYFRPWTFSSLFYVFDGANFFEITDGLTEAEKNLSTVNAMCFEKDTLFAGFSNPPSIKYFLNGVWNNYLTNFPILNYGSNSSILVASPTVVCFINNVTIIGTNYSGVLCWNKTNGWTNMSSGLPLLNKDINMYSGLNYLVYFKEALFTGFGTPNFSPYHNGLGVYKFNLQ